ncbi:MAG TPA: hypothetical protein VJA16_06755 [Thermoanaerobaculia bacterium]
MNEQSTPIVNAVAGFRLARLKAFLALALLLADCLVGSYVFADLHTRLDSLEAWVSLAAVLAVGAASLGLFVALWRCPVCHRWLGFSSPGSIPGVGGSDWWQQAFCPRCGAIFEKAPPSTGDPALDRRARIEATVKKDAKYYRSRAETNLVRSGLFSICGIAIVLAGFFGVPPGSGMMEVVAIGVLALVAGIAMMTFDYRRLTIGGKERERRLRLALEKREKKQRVST